ncbi:MAG: arginase [Clostridium sp.]|nr:arginase [Clostridium sp.]
MDINLIGVPLYYGCDKVGVDDGPNTLRKAGVKQALESKNNKVYDLGNIYVEKNIDKNPFNAGVNAKYIDEILEVNESLAQQVYASLCAKGFPVILGGDHSLAAGSLAGISKFYEDDLAVVWIDAHGDINTFETSPSGNVHGMPLAASMGVGDKSLTNLFFDGVKVNSKNVFIIGARDLDKGELELIKELKLNVWTMDDIKSIGMDKLCEQVKEKLLSLGVNNVHISFDVDSIDPVHIKGTGTPVPNGFTVDEGKEILKTLFDTKLVKSMDFVEFNPKLDDTDVTLNNCMDILKEVGTLI